MVNILSGFFISLLYRKNIKKFFVFQKNTVTETVDISDNYVESEGARYIAGMLRNNTFITNLVSLNL